MKSKFVSLTTKYTKNLGDEIQIIAANQFIEKDFTGTVDRERLSEYSGDKAKVLLNGWYFHNPRFWPPAQQLTPLITSFHITDLTSEVTGQNPRDVIIAKGNNRDFLLQNGPVGARDLDTYQFFLDNNIPTYFSGCMTLTLQPKGLKKDGSICSVDVSDDINSYISSKSDRAIVKLENSVFPDTITYDEKLDLAQKTLDTYERADLVVTTRLHAALPALALGTPVILIHNKNKDASRYLGLKDLVRNCDERDFLHGMYVELLADPTPNRDFHTAIVRNLKKIVDNFIHGRAMSFEEYQSIGSDNLRTVLWAKEENEKDFRAYSQRLHEEIDTLKRPAPKKDLVSRVRGRALRLTTGQLR